MSDLADDLYQAYKEGRTTLRFPEPDFTGLTTPDLFRHIAAAIGEVDEPLTEEDLEEEWDAGYRVGWNDHKAFSE